LNIADRATCSGRELLSLRARRNIPSILPPSFDASTFEIWGALLNGGRLALMPQETSSLEDLLRAVRQYGVTTLWLTAGSSI